jgi:hypothetical protein
MDRLCPKRTTSLALFMLSEYKRFDLNCHGRYLVRNETFTGLKLLGAFITLVSVCFIKVEKPKEPEVQEPNKTKYEAVPVDAIL